MENFKEEQEKQQAHIKAMYEDGTVTINGRDYTFTDMKFEDRVAVYSYASTIQNSLIRGNMGFLSSNEFKNIFKIISKYVLFDNESLDKNNVLERYMGDYTQFIVIALSVISYPFTNGETGE